MPCPTPAPLFRSVCCSAVLFLRRSRVRVNRRCRYQTAGNKHADLQPVFFRNCGDLNTRCTGCFGSTAHGSAGFISTVSAVSSSARSSFDILLYNAVVLDQQPSDWYSHPTILVPVIVYGTSWANFPADCQKLILRSLVDQVASVMLHIPGQVCLQSFR